MLDDLYETEEFATKLRTEVEAHPNDEFLRINAESLAKRRADLVRRVNNALHVEQQDVVGYSIKRRLSGYPASAVAKSILTFQELLTAIFDALRSVPKARYRPSTENVELSTLDFAAARPGSVAIALHIPNDRLLLAQTELDISFDKLFELMKVRRQSDFRELVPQIGVASITKAYAWAEVSSSFGIDTSIRWGKHLGELKTIEVAHEEAVAMRDAIAATSSEEVDDFTYDFLLEGIDPVASYFHAILSDGSSIKGETSPDFPRVEWTTRKHYKAELIRTVVLKFSTGETKETWTLKNLTPIE
jgi:hypothetical protein